MEREAMEMTGLMDGIDGLVRAALGVMTQLQGMVDATEEYTLGCAYENMASTLRVACAGVVGGDVYHPDFGALEQLCARATRAKDGTERLLMGEGYDRRD